MRRTTRLLIKLTFWIVILIAIYLITTIAVGIITDYQPDEVTSLEITGISDETIPDSTFTILTWNIGFAGLGAEMDFFFDGGKMVHPNSEQVKKFTDGILHFLQNHDSIDFIFLQEVDRNSTRTNQQDEMKLIQNVLPNYSSSFGYNYKVEFVPIPFFNPLGKIEMGQMNLSKYHPVSSQRFSYFSEYTWPKRLFMLDRCFIVSRYQLPNKKELVIMNTHNSAYDSSGKLRDVEMPSIRDLMLEEFAKGNYVIAGGDWNQNPPDYIPSTIETMYNAVQIETMDNSLFPEKWEICYDHRNPTNRGIESPLTSGETKVTVIDYFILSPNIELKEITVLPQNFQNSDHNPVYLRIALK